MQLVQVNPEQYGLEPSKANEILGSLPQIKAEREILANQFHQVIQMDIELTETHKLAKSLRLKIAGNRTKGIEAWHKKAKEYFLRGGQFVDAIKRLEIDVNQQMEARLKEIEDYEENLRIMYVNKRFEERWRQIMELDLDIHLLTNTDYLRECDDEEFDRQLRAAELSKKEFQEQAKKLALAKLNQDRKEKLLPYWHLLEDKSDINDLGALTDAEFDTIYQLALSKHNEAKAETERLRKIEQEKIMQEQKAKEAERLRQLEAERLASAPIREQLNAWLVSEFPQVIFDIYDHPVARDIEVKYQAFLVWAKKQIDGVK